MGRIEELANRYQSHVSAPWQRDLAGAQKTIFVVYDKTDERKLRAKLELYEMATRQSGHGWKLVDFTGTFARWMASMEYRDPYFRKPAALGLKLKSDFVRAAAAELRDALIAPEVDENTVVAAYGVGCLYGFTKVSLVLKETDRDIRGRLVLFFPGEFDNNNYRLLDARDGWNYLAVPITLRGGTVER
ncbi:MAG: BREX protein BrxB domain-containing protein [Acidobacteriota bacterium]